MLQLKIPSAEKKIKDHACHNQDPAACMRTLQVCKSVGRGRVGGKELKKRLQMVKRNHGIYF